MTMGITPVGNSNSVPLDFSSLSAKSGEYNGLGSGGNSTIDPSTLLFANQGQTQVNFAPPNSTDSSSSDVNAASGTSASGLVEQIMSLLQQLMQMLAQNKNVSSNPQNDPSPQGGGAGNSVAGSGTGDDGAGIGSGEGGLGGEGSTSNASALDGVPPDTSLRGSGGLHLPQQLEQYRGDIMDAANATGMPPSVIAGQIWAESRGQLNAATTNVNGKADAGLMQVNADTFKSLQQQNPGLLGNDVNDSHTNIMAGSLYLRDQNKAFGDIGAALRAYNSGPDKVNKADLSDTGGVGGSSYPADVLNFAKIIESGQGNLPS
ncbi:lytic transglycosylase domain-containing protein [Pseudomonas syringae group genomosp. 7]|uniref:Type III helper protein HopP1 n=2 Tax=Pseudomonas syringae group genomosp. 7 TaxID=251699 RepID=A0A3M6CLI2_9PSED|nr:Type III helper protein HopP1 [Pseudomonas syringae pv. tagetis]RMV44650.1 Type III helper protein HopP1 [Pseudomonas syringae pv. helianthi]RMW17731.1 Type III helper protein HopP1 [Pseudomonas syringae pv. tagetis]RMW20632.1 Type III helper protein HopP1 [Pseudomonas syringae pv. tagetis]